MLGSILLSFFSPAAAILLQSLPEDPFAFPKYRTTYLNGLPVLNETALRWLHEGLPGGELEFLEQPWQHPNGRPFGSPKEIGDSGETTYPDPKPSFTLELMKLGPHHSYLCLIPPPPTSAPPKVAEQPDEPISTLQSWSLLQPLAGTCLYHHQGWFTYSYCHNDEIRQFRELAHKHPHPPGYKPEEDPEEDSYSLGRAPPVPEPGADLTVAQVENLELARGADSRYLVQRWKDGTVCDKTGRRRDVEVQFHCSMTVADTIIFVKEAKTCSYIIVIHTPRLCGEPGFNSRAEAREEAFIRCREVVTATSKDRATLPEAEHPFTMKRTRPGLSPPAVKTVMVEKTSDSDAMHKMLRQALEAFVAKSGTKDGAPGTVEAQTEDGKVVYYELEYGEGEDDEIVHQRLAESLRAAGIKIQGEKGKDKKASTDKAQKQQGKEDEKQKKKGKGAGKEVQRDEL